MVGAEGNFEVSKADLVVLCEYFCFWCQCAISGVAILNLQK
jgi:hypothetical protein